MPGNTDDVDPEELLQQSSKQRRTATEPATTADSDPDTPALSDAVAEAFDELEAGDRNSTFGFRDERLVALLAGLERSGQLTDVVTDAQEALGRDVDADVANRSTAGSLLIRLGIQALDEDILDAAREGYEQHLTSKADEF